MTIDELRKAPGVVSLTVGKPPTMPGVGLVKKRPPDVRTGGRGRWSITLALACRVVSEANRRDHWTVKRRRREIQGDALRRAWRLTPVARHPVDWHGAFPCVVTWFHVGRTMDTDNLAGSFKGLRDELARWLDIDDGDPRIDWRYDQRIGTPGVEVRIESAR